MIWHLTLQLNFGIKGYLRRTAKAFSTFFKNLSDFAPKWQAFSVLKCTGVDQNCRNSTAFETRKKLLFFVVHTVDLLLPL